tara:strand:- start:229 stop:423 length:195 start_codon:yes stop_codon:yes gene_type:complete
MTNPNDFIESTIKAKYVDGSLSIIGYGKDNFRLTARLGKDSVTLILDREQLTALMAIYNANDKG